MAKIYSSLEVARETFETFLDLVNGNVKPGVLTGLDRLDSHLHGFQPGKLTILASRPSGGKTACALNIARNILHHDASARILYCSSDLDHIQLMTRLLCMESGLTIKQLQQGDFDSEKMSLLNASAVWVKSLPLWIDPSCGISVKELDKKIRNFLAQQPLDLIVIDPLELLKYEETSTAVKKIRRFAKEFQIPILLLATCFSKGKRCRLQHLAEGIADNGDTVIFLERKSMTHEGKIPVELTVARNNCGFTGMIPMEYTSRTMIYEEMPLEDTSDGSSN